NIPALPAAGRFARFQRDRSVLKRNIVFKTWSNSMKSKQILSCGSFLFGFMLVASNQSNAENMIPDEYKTGGVFIGCQAYTFNHYTVFEAIEKTAAAGGKVIEFFPGQKLSKEEPNVSWDHNASAETIQKVKD